MKSFVGLKAKMYTYITEDEHECKKSQKILRIMLLEIS